MTRYNPALFKLAMESLTQSLEKSSFVPMNPGMPTAPTQPPLDPAAAAGAAPPMDPAMMGGAGGAPPMDPAMMDPAMMGGAGGATPMDPAMMGGAGGQMDPAMLEGLAAQMGAADAESMGGGEPQAPASGGEEIKNQIKQVLTETGVIKPPKMKPEEQFNYIISVLNTICEKLGVQAPPVPEPGEGEGGGSKSGGKSEPKKEDKPVSGGIPSVTAGGSGTKSAYDLSAARQVKSAGSGLRKAIDTLRNRAN